MDEIWKDIVNEDPYQISNKGRVRNKINNNIKTPIIGKYMSISLNSHRYYIHRLVATYFIPFIPLKNHVNHKDENKHNNVYTNLEWCTNKENHNYGTIKDRMSKAQTSSKIIQYDKEGNIIKIWNSKEQISRELPCGSSIKNSITRNIFNRFYKDSYWFKEDEAFDAKRIKKSIMLALYNENKCILVGGYKNIADYLGIKPHTIQNKLVRDNVTKLSYGNYVIKVIN